MNHNQLHGLDMEQEVMHQEDVVAIWVVNVKKQVVEEILVENHI